MPIEKILGWVLLILGIFLIVYPLFTSYNIFTGKNQAPTIFKAAEKKETILPQKETKTLSPTELQKEMEKMIEEKLGEIFPTEFLLKLLNLISFSIFVGILIFAGSQISNLGIKLIKR